MNQFLGCRSLDKFLDFIYVRLSYIVNKKFPVELIQLDTKAFRGVYNRGRISEVMGINIHAMAGRK